MSRVDFLTRGATDKYRVKEITEGGQRKTGDMPALLLQNDEKGWEVCGVTITSGRIGAIVIFYRRVARLGGG